MFSIIIDDSDTSGYTRKGGVADGRSIQETGSATGKSVSGEMRQGEGKSDPGLRGKGDDSERGGRIHRLPADIKWPHDTIPVTKDHSFFRESITKFKRIHPYGAFVDVPEGNEGTFFLGPQGAAGAVVRDGNIISVFSDKNKGGPLEFYNGGKRVMLTALSHGGNRLDCYDGKISGEGLPNIYEGFGFIPAARLKFNDKYAPADWNYERDGRPDVIFYVHNGDSVETIISSDYERHDLSRVPYVKDYDEGIAKQREFLARREKGNEGTGREGEAGVGKKDATPGFTAEEAIGGKRVFSDTSQEKVDRKTVVTREKIIKAIDRLAPVRLGKLYKKGAAAVYKSRAGVIRARTGYAKRLRVLTHEMGHHIDSLIDMKAGKFKDELTKIPYVQAFIKKKPKASPATVLGEGVAEFVHLYLMNPPEAQKQCPELYEHFETALYEKHPSVYNGILNLRQMIGQYRARLSEDPAKRAEAHNVEMMGLGERKPGGINGLIQIFKNESRVLSNPFERIFTALSDEYLPMELMEAKLRGVELEETDVWKYARYETSDGMEDTLITVGLVDVDPNTGMPMLDDKQRIKIVGPSVMDMVKEIVGLGKTNAEGDQHFFRWQAYMLAKHIIEMEEMGITSGGTSEDFPGFEVDVNAQKAFVKDVESADYGKIYKKQLGELVKFRQHLWRTCLKGAYSDNDIERYLGKYKYPVPMYRRWIDRVDSKGKPAYSDRVMRKERGADLPVVPVMQSIMNEVRILTKIYKVRNTNEAFFSWMDKFPKEAGKFVEAVRLPTRVTNVSFAEVMDKLTEILGGGQEGMPLDYDEADINKITLNIFRPDMKNRKNLIIHWRDEKIGICFCLEQL